MNVTIVEPNGQGGLIHFAYQMAEALAAEGAEVTLITGKDYELSDLPRHFKLDASMQVLPIFSASAAMRPRASGLRRLAQRAVRGLYLIRAWMRITRNLRRDRPDVVIFSVINFPFQALCLRVLAKAGIPLLQVCHEIEKRDNRPGWWDRHVNAALFKSAYRAFSAIIFLAGSTERAFVAAFGDISRRVVLPHGPQLLFAPSSESRETVAARYGINPSERVILFFGLLRPSKGVAVLVEAFALLPDRHRLRLVIAGYPTKAFDTAQLKSQMERHGLSGQTSLFLDYVRNEDVAALFALADVVVFPYLNATASGAVSAAQSLGRPVIASYVGGLAEVVEDGVTGRLVPPGDPAALAIALQDVLADPQRSTLMAEAARADLLRHRSWTVFAKGVLGLIAAIDSRDAA